MADYASTPIHHEDHYIERDTSSNAGFWAIIAVLAVLLLLLLFGSNLFGSGNSNNNNTGTDVNGSIETPGGSGSGSVTY